MLQGSHFPCISESTAGYSTHLVPSYMYDMMILVPDVSSYDMMIRDYYANLAEMFMCGCKYSKNGQNIIDI